MTTRNKLTIVQPYLTKYRLPVFKVLAEKYDVCLIASESKDYGELDLPDNIKTVILKQKSVLSNALFWQIGLVSKILKEKPQLLFITANPRYLSTWLTIFIAKLCGVKVLLHGQGLYRKKTISFFNKVVYFLFNLLSDRYIAYTELSKDSLSSLPIYKKTRVADNSIVNQYPVHHKNTNANGILFVGRLRNGANIELLINAVINVNDDTSFNKQSIELYIVGGGTSLETYKSEYKEYPFIHFLGEIYDTKEVSNISLNCFASCYPGDAGLSVLHYQSLSLPPIIHSEMHSHMGPEPSYVVNNFNGIYFKRNSLKSLQEAISKLVNNPTQLSNMQHNTFKTYTKLTNPSLPERFDAIIQEVLNENENT
ncbi:hypothetical protein JCM30760_03350 [Thiomicrorhabdus hydrogeniphila]